MVISICICGHKNLDHLGSISMGDGCFLCGCKKFTERNELDKETNLLNKIKKTQIKQTNGDEINE